MSLIFQSLQKLKSNLSLSHSGSGSAASRQRHVPAKRYFQFRSILIGLAVVLALGCGTVYAVQVLRQRVGGQERQIAQDRRHAVPRDEVSLPDAVAASQRDRHLHLDAPQPEEKKALDVQARFYPPEARLPEQSLQPLSEIENVKYRPSGSLAVSASLPMAEKRKPPAVEAQPIYNVAMEAAEQARRAALEKSARIARLVRKIEQAMAGGPHAGNPQVLLGQLAQMKGERHPYVMKMRAYWNFKRGKYKAAEADLKRVIAVNPDDLEAGINLSLIEIHGKRYAEAMARLKHLRHTYPDQPIVADLIKRLK